MHVKYALVAIVDTDQNGVGVGLGRVEGLSAAPVIRGDVPVLARRDVDSVNMPVLVSCSIL